MRLEQLSQESVDFLSERTFLLGLGAQKTATTWFANYLGRHPDVFVSRIKEMHFFRYYELNRPWPDIFFRRQLSKSARFGSPTARDIELCERLQMDSRLERYVNFFSSRMSSESHFSEITPAYSMLPIVELTRIKNNFPKLKTFFFLRNPADRFWSQLLYSNRNNKSFDSRQALTKALSDQDFIKRSDYLQSIRNQMEVFNENERFIDFYERLFQCDAIQRFSEYARISKLRADFEIKRNASPTLMMKKGQRKRVVRKFRDQYLEIFDILQGDVPDSWLYDIDLLKV